MSGTTVRNRVGLALAGLLGLVEITGPSPAAVAAAFLFPRPVPGSEDAFSLEPMVPAVIAVIVAAVVLSLATITGVVIAWVTGNRVAARVVAGARVVSALMAAPVFLLQGMPAWIFVVAAVLVIADITAVILVLAARDDARRNGHPVQPDIGHYQ